jgi:hypothetical protein
MTRGWVRTTAFLVLSLLWAWGGQAQTAQDRPDRLTAPSASSAPQVNMTVAPSPHEVPAAITRQRQTLAAQRDAILQAEASQQAECWQKFAVNACLSEVRRARRQALEPLREQELALNAQERAWRTAQREMRLQGKQGENRTAP